MWFDKSIIIVRNWIYWIFKMPLEYDSLYFCKFCEIIKKMFFLGGGRLVYNIRFKLSSYLNKITTKTLYLNGFVFFLDSL